VAQIMAIEHPSRVSGLILANTCADCTAPETVAAIDSWVELFEHPMARCVGCRPFGR
jgi:hypothetical protein